MNRATISVLSVLLTAAAIAPAAQAAPKFSEENTLHDLRIEELDAREKQAVKFSEGETLQQLRLEELDERDA